MLLDVISPCVTFNDHEGSTKSYAYVKDHDEPLGEISFVPFFEDISVDYEPGTLDRREDARRVAGVPEEAGRAGYDPQDKLAALTLLHESSAKGEFATGLIYIEPDRPRFIDLLNIVDTPLSMLPDAQTRPGRRRSRRSWSGCGSGRSRDLQRWR